MYFTSYCLCLIVTGAIGMVWFIFWLCLAYEKPSEHPTISEDERTLIEKRQGASAITYGVT